MIPCLAPSSVAFAFAEHIKAPVTHLVDMIMEEYRNMDAVMPVSYNEMIVERGVCNSNINKKKGWSSSSSLSSPSIILILIIMINNFIIILIIPSIINILNIIIVIIILPVLLSIVSLDLKLTDDVINLIPMVHYDLY